MKKKKLMDYNDELIGKEYKLLISDDILNNDNRLDTAGRRDASISALFGVIMRPITAHLTVYKVIIKGRFLAQKWSLNPLYGSFILRAGEVLIIRAEPIENTFHIENSDGDTLIVDNDYFYNYIKPKISKPIDNWHKLYLEII